MATLYKLSKGSLSKIRDNESAARALMKDGFILVGECNAEGVVISTNVVFESQKKSKGDPKGFDE